MGDFAVALIFSIHLPKHPLDDQKYAVPQKSAAQDRVYGLLAGWARVLCLPNQMLWDRLLGGLMGKSCFTPIFLVSNWGDFMELTPCFLLHSYFHVLLP